MTKQPTGPCKDTAQHNIPSQTILQLFLSFLYLDQDFMLFCFQS